MGTPLPDLERLRALIADVFADEINEKVEALALQRVRRLLPEIGERLVREEIERLKQETE
ncbi:MAG: hypothetical protein HQL50_10895 [Magnetococcales bacterium]|nr:hypothetical protein [Magnetococcales bacterium]